MIREQRWPQEEVRQDGLASGHRSLHQRHEIAALLKRSERPVPRDAVARHEARPEQRLQRHQRHGGAAPEARLTRARHRARREHERDRHSERRERCGALGQHSEPHRREQRDDDSQRSSLHRPPREDRDQHPRGPQRRDDQGRAELRDERREAEPFEGPLPHQTHVRREPRRVRGQHTAVLELREEQRADVIQVRADDGAPHERT